MLAAIIVHINDINSTIFGMNDMLVDYFLCPNEQTDVTKAITFLQRLISVETE